jgi:hypothetical protein
VDDRKRGQPLRGREQIGDYFRQAMTHLAATAHLLTNVDVDVDPHAGTASATSRVTAYHWSLRASDEQGARPADFVLLATYDDLLGLTSDGWRISRRTVNVLGPEGLAVGTLPAVFAGFGGAS